MINSFPYLKKSMFLFSLHSFLHITFYGYILAHIFGSPNQLYTSYMSIFGKIWSCQIFNIFVVVPYHTSPFVVTGISKDLSQYLAYRHVMLLIICFSEEPVSRPYINNTVIIRILWIAWFSSTDTLSLMKMTLCH